MVSHTVSTEHVMSIWHSCDGASW